VFYDWHVSYASKSDGPSTPLASGDPFDPDANQTDPPVVQHFDFAPPPVGDWIVNVTVHFFMGGDATYAWHVTII
jgi:hypothetical protein